MQKVPGVTSVKVSLNDGLTILDFAPDNTVTLAQLRQIIRNNGFVTNESRIVARGTLSTSNRVTTFEVRGSRERLTLAAPPPAGASSDVVMTGTVNTRNPKALSLSVVKLENP